MDVSALGRPTSVAVCKNRHFVAAAIAADPLFQEGPSGELEAVNGVVVNGRTYAFTIVERIGGIMVYDVSDPAAPRFQQYINNRDFTQGMGDRASEGIVFIPAGDAPGFSPLVAVAHEETGTTTLYQIKPKTKRRHHIWDY